MGAALELQLPTTHRRNGIRLWPQWRTVPLLSFLAGSDGLLRYEHDSLRQQRRKELHIPARGLHGVPAPQEGETTNGKAARGLPQEGDVITSRGHEDGEGDQKSGPARCACGREAFEHIRRMVEAK